MVAPGCFGGSAARPTTTLGAAAPARLRGPLQLLAPAGAVPTADRIGFARSRGVAIDVRTSCR